MKRQVKGVSDYTPEKQRILHIIASKLIGISGSSKFPHMKPMVIDATAADGRRDAGSLPSPEILSILANRSTHKDIPVYLIEKHPISACSLKSAALCYPGNVTVRLGAWEDVITEKVLPIAKHEGYNSGLLYIDHNASWESRRGFDVIEKVCREMPMMDIVINQNSTSLKRTRQVKDQLLSDILRSLKRKHIMIRRPCTAHQWTFIVATNASYDTIREFGRINMVSLKSDEGMAIYLKLQMTSEELDDLHNLRGIFSHGTNALFRSKSEIESAVEMRELFPASAFAAASH